jgi:hypothetical protein
MSLTPPTGAEAGNPFVIRFPQGQAATAAAVDSAASPLKVARALGLATGRPAMAVLGGAGMMSPEAAVALRAVIEDGLAQFTQAHDVTVVDGGTAAGVMGLMGTARARRGYSFPLVGVAPLRRVSFPGFDNPDHQAELDPNHSHFALTSGDEFGAESDLLAGLALAVAADDRPALTVVINGGEIVKREAHARATRGRGGSLLVLQGSGRLADALAQSRVRPSDDPLIRETLEKGDVHFVDIAAGPSRLLAWLESFYRF